MNFRQPRGRDEFLRDRHPRRFRDLTRVPRSLRQRRDGDRAPLRQHACKDATACLRGGNYPRENVYDQNIEDRNRDLDKKSQLRLRRRREGDGASAGQRTCDGATAHPPRGKGMREKAQGYLGDGEMAR